MAVLQRFSSIVFAKRRLYLVFDGIDLGYESVSFRAQRQILADDDARR